MRKSDRRHTKIAQHYLRFQGFSFRTVNRETLGTSLRPTNLIGQ